MPFLKANFPVEREVAEALDRKREAFEQTVLEKLGGSIVLIKGRDRKFLYF